MPPIAHKNRKHTDFLVEMPQGQMHLDNSGRKHFNSLQYKNAIEQQKLLTSPQKYPYQNRIAFDKSYLRSLNTVDIEGASPNTLISMAVKNKMKAQEQLNRRKMQKNQMQYHNKLKMYQNTDEEQKRQLALRQFKRNNQLNQLISKRNYHEKVMSQEKNHKTEVIANKEIQLQSQNSKLIKQQKPVYQNPNNIKQYSYFNNNPEGNLPPIYNQKQVYSPIQHIQENNYQNINKNQFNLYQRNHSFNQNKQQIKDNNLQRLDQTHKNNNQEQRMQSSQLTRIYNSRQELRKHNPTYLSYASPSIRLAGKNIAKY